MTIVSTSWDGSAGRFSDGEYEASCVLDRKICGGDWADKPPKERCSLPIKEPNGDLNSEAVKAAAARISQVTDACPASLSKAKAALRSAYSEIGEDVPDSLTEEKSKSEDDPLQAWGVRAGEPRHGEVAVRADPIGLWVVRSKDEGAADDTIGYLTGHFAVFNRFTEINSLFEGRFMERMAPGAFSKTFDENREAIRCLYQHGKDPQIGLKPLGPVRELDQDETGALYGVDLFDTSYNRDLLPGLKHNQYGASFRFQVVREKVDPMPDRSEHNPNGIEERTITEARVREFGPCTFGAYSEATSGIRSMNDEMLDSDMLRSSDPERVAYYLNSLQARGVNLGTAELPRGQEGSTDQQHAHSSDAPESTERDAGKETRSRKRDSLVTSRSGFTTLTPRSARTLRTSRTTTEEPRWKL